MKKKISAVAVLSIFLAGSVQASGWRIPEQSVDSTAKVGANIASAKRADAAYYNPANMGWMADAWQGELDLTYIYLSEIDYEDARTPLFNDSSETEHFFVPTGFLVSPDYSGWRFGFSLVAPYGLAKRWDTGYGKAFSEEFSLTTYEANPTVSYTFGDKFSIAGGVRMIYADATVKSDASVIGVPLSRDMTGDTIEWGWNAAAAYKPIEALNFSATYRSYIDLSFDDTAKLTLMGLPLALDATVAVPAPAVFALSVAYDFMPNLNVELTWDRTFWSEYDELDFDFTPMIPGNPFEPPLERNWDDTDAFRLGVTWGVTDKAELMFGFAYDNNPIPTEHVDFSIPDSDAWLYSIGMQYQVSEKMELGVAALYDYKESRKNLVDPNSSVYGEFTNASALLITVGLNYTF